MNIPYMRAAWASTLAAFLAALTASAGCTPALNWRDVGVPDGSLRVLMPCRPAAQDRALSLSGKTVKLQLLSCDASDLMWAVAQADVMDAGLSDAALSTLRAAAFKNVGADGGRRSPVVVPGSTVGPQSGRWRIDGHLPDGRSVQMQIVLFADASRVYQATAFGTRVPEDAADTFFGSLRIGR